MFYEIAQLFPEDMIFEQGGPFISLYQPTHRYFPERKQDPIVFKNLLRQIENSLETQSDKDFISSILTPFYEIEGDNTFWNKTADGIAVLACPGRCIVYHLHSPVEEFAVVAKSFHIKPLVQAFQSVESYQLLGLSRNSFALYQGNRYGFSEIEIDPEIPVTLEDVLGKQLTEPYSGQGAAGGTGETAVFHGQGDKKEESDKDTEKYFRYVDRFVFENYSKPSKMPLILVALKEHHAQFQALSHNSYLIEEGVNVSYESLEIEQLKSKALEIIEPINEKNTKILTDAFKKAQGEFGGSSDLAQVAKAAFESRVETMLIEEDRIIPGKIDPTTGGTDFCDITSPDCDDILDDLMELVLKNGGSVWVLPKDKMPCQTGVAAIYRYH